MSMLLVVGQNEHLADSVSLLDSGQFEHVFAQSANKQMSIVGLLFEHQKIHPGIDFFFDEAHTVDIKQEHDLHPLFELDEIFVIAQVFYNHKLFVVSGVSVDEFASLGRLPCSFVLLLCHELLLFHELLAPAVESYVVIAFVSEEQVFQEFYMFKTEFLLLLLWLFFGLDNWLSIRLVDGFLLDFVVFLRLRLFHQLDPIMHGAGEEVEQELGARRHGFFTDFIRENLVEVVRVKLLILISIPQPDFGVAAFDIFFFLSWRLEFLVQG